MNGAHASSELNPTLWRGVFIIRVVNEMGGKWLGSGHRGLMTLEGWGQWVPGVIPEEQKGNIAVPRPGTYM